MRAVLLASEDVVEELGGLAEEGHVQLLALDSGVEGEVEVHAVDVVLKGAGQDLLRQQDLEQLQVL